MKSQFTPDYMSHIAQAIQRVNNYIKYKEAWLESTLVQDAVIRNLEALEPHPTMCNNITKISRRKMQTPLGLTQVACEMVSAYLDKACAK